MRLLNRALAASEKPVATNPNAWDLSKFLIKSDSTWDVSKATFSKNTTGSFGATPRGMFFKDDGTKLFITGSSGDWVREFALERAWDTKGATLTYTMSISAQEVQPSGIFFKPDGLKFYICGFTEDAVHQYDLTTAWDIQTASYANKEFSLSSQEGNPQGIFFKPDGLKMYITGQDGDDVNEYDLTTAWDVSTATFNQSFSFSAYETAPQDVHFGKDGEKMYIMGSTGDDINEFDLTTAWDVSTASYLQSYGIGGYESAPSSLFFKPDGTRFWVIGYTGDDINEFVIDPQMVDVNPPQAAPRGLFFKSDGTKMYIVGTTGPDYIHEFDLTTAWDVTTASYNNNYFEVTQDDNPNGMFWRDNGEQFWVVGTTNAAIYQYSCSTAWDVSTASYANKSFTNIGEAAVQDVFIGNNGSTLYYAGSGSDDVSQVPLTTAWDISTASSSSITSTGNLSRSAPSGLFFKSDGTKMYISSYGTNEQELVDEYDLTTAWDVTTKQHSLSLQVWSTIGYTRELYFKPDGTSLFVTGQQQDRVVRWDVA